MVFLAVLETAREQFYMQMLSMSRMAWETVKCPTPAKELPQAPDLRFSSSSQEDHKEPYNNTVSPQIEKCLRSMFTKYGISYQAV